MWISTIEIPKIVEYRLSKEKSAHMYALICPHFWKLVAKAHCVIVNKPGVELVSWNDHPILSNQSHGSTAHCKERRATQSSTYNLRGQRQLLWCKGVSMINSEIAIGRPILLYCCIRLRDSKGPKFMVKICCAGLYSKDEDEMQRNIRQAWPASIQGRHRFKADIDRKPEEASIATLQEVVGAILQEVSWSRSRGTHSMTDHAR
jgi:hypothetical protein